MYVPANVGGVGSGVGVAGSVDVMWVADVTCVAGNIGVCDGIGVSVCESAPLLHLCSAV